MAECQHMKTVPVPNPPAAPKVARSVLVIGNAGSHLRSCSTAVMLAACDQSMGSTPRSNARTRARGHPLLEPGEGLAVLLHRRDYD